MKRKKELKKINQKEKKVSRDDNGALTVGDPVKEPVTTCVTVNESDEADGIKEDIPEDEALTESDHTISENDPEFIGPKLPPRMTKAEIKAFYNELMGKLKFPS